MSRMLCEATYFGAMISLAAYFFGIELKKRLKISLLNPLLVAIIITIGILVAFHVDYESYYAGAKYLSYLLTPATICLAIPLYEEFEVLKKNAIAILAGISSGVLTSLISILCFAILFGFTHKEYVTFLPKSITTAIGMVVSEEFGGFVSITVAVIVITGVIGNVIAEAVLKLFRIEEPVAKGVAIGTSSHAIGTTKAMEIGEVEGALSSLSIVVAGLLTVVFANFFSHIL